VMGKRYNHTLSDFKKLKLDFRLNELSFGIEVKLRGEWQTMDKFVEAVVRTELRELGYGVQGKKKPSRDAVKEAWMTLAFENRYNPIKNYFNELRKQPYEPRMENDKHQPYLIHKFSKDYFHNPDKMLGPWQFRWMVGAIAKADKQERNPILVMGGEQDKGKSTYVRWLCPLQEYFREGPIRPDSKDERLRLTDTFIQEIPEVGNTTRRSDEDAFKDHVTRKYIIERPPYGGGPVKMPAACSFYATVNPDGAGFLTDLTGSTRFLICEVNHIDFTYTEWDVHKLWREALWFYDNTYRAWELLPSEKMRRDEINAKYQMVNALDEIIDQYLIITNERDDFLASIEIRNCLAPHYRINNENGFYRELARVLKARGLRHGREPYKGDDHPHRKGWSGIKKRAKVMK